MRLWFSILHSEVSIQVRHPSSCMFQCLDNANIHVN
jgi:hypothetical protein